MIQLQLVIKLSDEITKFQMRNVFSGILNELGYGYKMLLNHLLGVFFH